MYNFHKFAVVPVRLDVCHGPARGGVHWRRLFVLLSHGSLFGAARGACVAAAELLARRLRAVNARLETPPWLSSGRELPERAAALWREAARCERLRAVTTRLHDGTIAQVTAKVLPSVLLTASSMPALHPCFAGVQLSFQSQRWERNALRCPCFVAKRCSRRATPRASSS